MYFVGKNMHKSGICLVKRNLNVITSVEGNLALFIKLL